MIGWILLGTNDVERAGRFYDALLGEIGANRVEEIGNENSIHWRAPSGEVTLGVHVPLDGRPATRGNGSMIALAVNDSEEVDALYAKALELGAKDEGPPGPRGTRERYRGDEVITVVQFYGAYLRDLDGNKLLFYVRGTGGH
jgi:catechol 2,3-dioxygenase-like lactoylglutathione lyase family enzyme